MKAKNFAAILLEHPEYEVIFHTGGDSGLGYSSGKPKKGKAILDMKAPLSFDGPHLEIYSGTNASKKRDQTRD
jgi:hypothetical protein